MEVSSDLTHLWVEGVGNVIHEEVICGLEADLADQDSEVIGACEEVCVEETVQTIADSHSTTHNLPSDTEILMVPQTSDIESIYIVPQDQSHDYLNIQVTEEVITDNWDRSGPDDGVDIPETKVSHDNLLEYDDMEIPIEQDPYTNTRPYPCDFCSRRFRKKANLMNHMTSHQNDRPHGCNLCGARYVRKCDLMNHLKTHAYAPPRDGSDDDLNDDDTLALEEEEDIVKGRRKKIQSFLPRKRKSNATVIAKRNLDTDALNKLDKFGGKSYEYIDEDMHLVDEMTTRGANAKASSSRWTESLIVADSQPPRWPIADPTKPYVCQYCGMGFAREKALASHSRFHAGDSPYECSNCSDMFWDPNALRDHMRVKHGMPSTDIEYDINETYANEERFGQFYCDVCAVAFDRIDLLKRHRKIHVKQETEDVEEEGSNQHHVCNVCGEWFEEALALLAHAELHASRSPSRRCLLCGARCRDDAEVAEHVRQNHADDAPPNTCTLCGKTCKDKRSLLKHSWVHNVDKTFGCTKCGKSFHSKARLRRHMVSHRNKMVACDECGEEFPDGRALVSHRHSHNKELGGRTFPCRECGKTFGSRSSQQIHIRIHTGEKPYGCRFCWKAFADGGTLRKHERIHTGEKPYGCAICPRAFNQRVVLREHVRAHHSGPDPKYHGTLTPFYCKVCGGSFATSEEIVLHIVQHCDDNTALRRQPQVGPRKYKRRRKLKPHESPIPVLTSKSNENFNTLELGSESDDNTKRKLGRKNKQNRSNVEEGYQNVLKSFESSLQNINSIVNNSKTLSSAKSKLAKKKLKKDDKKVTETQSQAHPGRPRMIHTQKTRVPVELGTDGAKKGQKTKTMVTRTPKVMPAEHKLGIFPGGERNRPRTKNVSYHSDGKFQITPATFPKPKESSDDLSTAIQSITPEIIKMELIASSNKSSNNYESNNGNIESISSKQESLSKKKVIAKGKPGRRAVKQVTIKQEPQEEPEEIIEDVHNKNNEEFTSSAIFNQPEIDGNNMEVAFEANVIADEEEHEAILPDLDNVNHTENLTNKVKLSVKVESTTPHEHLISNVTDDVPETIIPDAIEYTCEMCSAVFSSRNELLNHVPIHI